MEIHTGIYEQIINQLFSAKLKEVDTQRFYVGQKPIDKAQAVTLLSKYLQHLLEVAFASLPDDTTADQCTDFVNAIIKNLGREFKLEDADLNLIDASKTILTAVVDRTQCDYPDIQSYLESITPVTSLSRSALFFGGESGVSMESELNREILSADEICWVVSFIKNRGTNLLWNSLKQFTADGKKLRIITTTYTGATDFEAVKRLSLLPNTEVKVSYDGSQDRLHAKSYIFLRKSGFHTAYIGSSNLSFTALKEGKEWNFKATQFELPQVIDSVRNSFESYWNDETFETFVPGVSDAKLKKALNMDWENPLLDFSALDLMRAKDYQEEILEKLDVERNVHGRFRNLVVAATGTGKTVIAAFDFKRFREQHPDCHFLFVAHRQEILRQAMTTFRTVLEDPNFGDVWDGSHDPLSYKAVFASKDTLRNRMDSLYLPEAYYDYMIVDEVHHVVAPSYVKIVQYFKPKILLGLTATPERTNAAEDITQFFDGHISAEIRLPAALNAGLLCPFHYYGIPDNVDLTQVKWTPAGYDPGELTSLYTRNDYRTGLILRKMQEYIGQEHLFQVKALCFCATIEHARYMHAKFTLAGLRCDVLTGADDAHHRVDVQLKLRSGAINYLFVVDIFNEGVDIPEVDTVLFLRPTESAIVFLQQFGRGLRLHKGKDHLTVLDFVGHSRAEFSYKERFESMMGRNTRNIIDQVRDGFPDAPFGCKIVLEEKAQQEVLQNIQNFINRMRKNQIVKEIAAFYKLNAKQFCLASFLKYSQVPLPKLFVGKATWNTLCLEAGVLQQVSPLEAVVNFAVSKKWLATDAFSYFSALLMWIDQGLQVDVSAFTEKELRLATMFYYDLYDQAGAFESLQQMFDTLAADALFVREIGEVLQLLRDACKAPEKDDNSAFAAWNPLSLHGVYTKAQIQAALGLSVFEKKSPSREGVERNKALHLEAMYVDIIKERDPDSNTNYKDFAQSRTRFHWETQNRVGAGSKEAVAYQTGANHMLLFVRQQAEDPELSCRMGFTYLGEVDLESMEGSKPMQIVWNLRTPMSEATYAFASKYKAIG